MITKKDIESVLKVKQSGGGKKELIFQIYNSDKIFYEVDYSTKTKNLVVAKWTQSEEEGDDEDAYSSNTLFQDKCESKPELEKVINMLNILVN